MNLEQQVRRELEQAAKDQQVAPPADINAAFGIADVTKLKRAQKGLKRATRGLKRTKEKLV